MTATRRWSRRCHRKRPAARSLPVRVHAQLSDRTLTVRRKSPGEIGLELFRQHRNAFAAATWMADRIFDLDWTGACAIAETDLHRVGVRSRRAIEQQLRVARLFAQFHK